MRIARITGRVSATVKAEGLVGKKMLLADVINSAGAALEESIVVVDACGAGPGDLVLVATGSAARVAQSTSGIPTDATAVAFIDEMSVGNQPVDLDRIALPMEEKGK